VGIGVNVAAGSVLTADQLDYPATFMETWLDRDVDRMVVMLGILESLARWWPRLGSEELTQSINAQLAFRDQDVEVVGESKVVRGLVRYVRSDGRLRIATESGEISVGSGGVRLRPIDLLEG
jgi:biotin-(acetyl-CoA carboxylase) ligase